MFALSPVLVLLIAQSASSAQPKVQASPVLQVGIFSYGPDGKAQAAAYDTTLATESFQYVAGCEVGAGNRPIPDRATDAWRLSGKVQSLSADEVVVRVDWQRVRAGGIAVTSPGGSVQLTLHEGDRVPLDSANPEPTMACGGRLIGFEARFSPRPAWMIGPGGSRSDSLAGTIIRGSGTGAGTGSGGGSTFVAGTGASAGRAVHMPKADSSSDTSARTYTAELFLVRTDKAHPEKPDFNLQGLILPAVRTNGEFAFSPFTIDTPNGPLNVQITGLLRVTAEDTSPQLVVMMARTIKYSSSNSNRDSTSSVTGSSTTKNVLPRPDEVLSFELPPIKVPNSSVTLPDQLSVRVRIR